MTPYSTDPLQDVAMVVVIPTSGRGGLLERALGSIADSQLPPNLAAVRVVENGPKGDANEVVASFVDRLPISYSYQPVGNKSRALNQAIADLDDELVVFFDDDVRVGPGTLAAYAAELARRGRGYFLAGRCDTDYETPPALWLRQYLPRSAIGWQLDRPVVEIARPIALGFNWAAFAADVKAAGGFPVGFGPGTRRSVGDETELQKRLYALGLKAFYLDEARVWHYVPAQRCSVEWALNRAYQLGSYVGYVNASRLAAPQRLYLCWKLRGKLALMRLRLRLTAAPLHDPKGFKRRYWLRYIEGKADALRSLEEESHQPAPSVTFKPIAIAEPAMAKATASLQESRLE